MYNASSGHRLSWPIKEYLIKNPVSIIIENKIGETFSNSNPTFLIYFISINFFIDHRLLWIENH
jgi:hypothetical protein